jgi:hypothetical protein
VNFKPVSLHEILSNRDKQGIISEQPSCATSLTRQIFDEKRMKQERGARQSMMGLRAWLCYVETILASTVIGNIFFAFFFLTIIMPRSRLKIIDQILKSEFLSEAILGHIQEFYSVNSQIKQSFDIK